MPRILSLHIEEVDLGLETLKFQCAFSPAGWGGLVLYGGIMQEQYTEYKPEGKRGGEYRSLSQGHIANDLQTLSSIEQCEVLVFTWCSLMTGPDVSTFT